MIINYNDRDITLKFSFRADMLFEDATGHSFAAASESEWLKYMFCTIVALTKDESMTFDDFLDWVSENPTVFYNFVKWYTDYQTAVMQLRQTADEQSPESKKKVTRSRKK